MKFDRLLSNSIVIPLLFLVLTVEYAQNTTIIDDQPKIDTKSIFFDNLFRLMVIQNNPGSLVVENVGQSQPVDDDKKIAWLSKLQKQSIENETSMDVSMNGKKCWNELFDRPDLQSINDMSFLSLLKTHDSSASLPNGLMEGTSTSFGDFDQCLMNDDQLTALENRRLKEPKSSNSYCFLVIDKKLQQNVSMENDDDSSLMINSSVLSSLINNNTKTYALIQQWLRLKNNPMPIGIGLCLPSSCDFGSFSPLNDDGTLSMVSLVEEKAIRLDFSLKYCQKKNKKLILDLGEENLTKLAPLIFLVAIGLATIMAGTILEYWSELMAREKSLERNSDSIQIKLFDFINGSFLLRKISQLLQCFSLITNVRLLFGQKPIRQNGIPSNHRRYDSELANHDVGDKNFKNHRQKNEEIDLEMVNGLRVVAILWVIFSHCSAFTQVPMLMKLSPFAHYPNDFIRIKQNNWLVSAFLFNTYFAVSIFFMISGLLLGFQYKKKRSDRPSQCNVLSHCFGYLIRRLFRILPTFLTIMGLTYYLQYLGNGPLFHSELIRPFVEPCWRNFWYHFFFLHNYLPIEERCGSHTWYLAADVHLHLIAIIFIHWIKCQRQHLKAAIFVLLVVVVCALLPFALTVFNVARLPNFDVFLDPKQSVPKWDLIMFYYSTHMHVDTFFLGVFIGLALSSKWNLKFLIKQNSRRLMLIGICLMVCVTGSLAMRFLVFDNPESSETDLSPLFKLILFQSFSYSFKISLAVLTYICAISPRTLLSRLMSASVMRPLARMTFGAYLGHQLLIWFTVQQTRSPIYINTRFMFAFISMIVGMTLILASILYLMVECPYSRMGKLIFSNQLPNSENNENGCSNHDDGGSHNNNNNFDDKRSSKSRKSKKFIENKPLMTNQVRFVQQYFIDEDEIDDSNVENTKNQSIKMTNLAIKQETNLSQN